MPDHMVEKAGITKVIRRLPWFAHGEFGGFPEISAPIPTDLPHFRRE